MRLITFISLYFLFNLGYSSIQAQEIVIKGYTFETGNRGYLGMVKVKLYDSVDDGFIADTYSDAEGAFELIAPSPKTYYLLAVKDSFEESKIEMEVLDNGSMIQYIKIPLNRKPGYLLEGTLAPTRANEDIVVDAITNARIEVFNNTTNKQILDLKSHPSHRFSTTLEDGNHYTLMIRKKGFFTKRIEAFVNVKGCILCFEGLGAGGVSPGVADNLTRKNTMGTLVANIEMTPVIINQEIEIENIYYDLGRYSLKKESKEELDNLAKMLANNPILLFDIAAHTDSRGDGKFNMELSQLRAEEVVKYLISINSNFKTKLRAIGYGESKLTNKCKNGVNCSEDQHQENRRTEFIVRGHLDNTLIKNQSLKEIIEMEKIRELEISLIDQKAITIDDSTDLPDDLKAYIASQQQKANPKETSNEDELGSLHSDKNDSIFVSDSIKNNTSTTHIIDASHLAISSPNKPFLTKSFETGFKGFSVQILHSIHPIAPDHYLLRTLGNLYLYQSTGVNQYCIGTFTERRSALKFMNTYLLEKYPTAEVIAVNQ